MPGSNGSDTSGRRDSGQQQRAAHVERESQAKAQNHKPNPAENREPVKFAEEQRNHQRSLERADATARVVDADPPGGYLDDIAVLNHWNSKCTKQFDCRRDVKAHQRLG
jgi:hypothetical protein